MRNIAEYISGYVDGEGCFTVTFNIRSKARLGLELRPSFSVSQNEDRRQVLDLMQEYFGCGAIRPARRDKTMKYEVRDKDDLKKKIIPHFRKYPLLSAKQRDFELFANVCDQVYRKRHLTPAGFINIIQLAYQMNGSGQRKRTAEHLIPSLSVKMMV